MNRGADKGKPFERGGRNATDLPLETELRPPGCRIAKFDNPSVPS